MALESQYNLLTKGYSDGPVIYGSGAPPIGRRKSVDKFVSNQLGKKDLARSAHFRFRIEPPVGPNLGVHELEDNINMMCESTVFPDITSVGIDGKVGSAYEYQIVNFRNYASIEATFLCHTDLFQKKFFERWMDLTFDHRSGQPRYYNEYKGTMYIYQLKHNFIDDLPGIDESNDWTYCVKLHDVYPNNISTMPVSWGDSNTIQKITVTFHFRYYNSSQHPTIPK